MKRQFHLLAVILFVAAIPFFGFGNNLTISNVTYVQGTPGYVSFDLRWENSWRNTSVAPHNWDAAWVFVKWRSCDSTSQAQFVHGTISSNTSDHTFNGTSLSQSGGPTIFDATTSKGVGNSMDGDQTGVMLRNSQEVSGIVNGRITLKVLNFPSSGSYDVRVYGLEMVFCTQSPFFLGDANGGTTIATSGTNNQSTGCFAAGTSAPNSNRPLYITSENTQNIYESSQVVCSGGTCSNVSINFPKGYGAFYIMKYEISQGQYADFLSANSIIAQQMHFPNNNTSLNYYSGTNSYTTFTYNSAINQFSQRYSILPGSGVPNQYVAIRPDRACNWMSWSDFSAYLVWAALRPLSEMEYEKACRGPLVPVPFERAWGTSILTIPAVNGISGTENGTETINLVSSVPPQANVPTAATSFNNWSTGDGNGIPGPLRCGIFAKSGNTTRIQSGSSYYGVQDLTGNVAEYYISALCGAQSERCNNGLSWGSGTLDFGGNANVANWPDKKNPYSPSSSLAYVISRGGSWYTDATMSGQGVPNDPSPNTSSSMLNVSSRSASTTYYHYVLNSTNYGRLRDPMTGGRGGDREE